MKNQSLKAENRKLLGRKVKQLRREGIIPANIFGKKVKSESIQVGGTEFEKVYKEVGETNILEIHLGKKKNPVLVHNVQLDPVTDAILHVDFLQVDLKEKVTAQIPIELVGEAPAEKQGLGTIVQHMDEVEIEALPTDLPEKFEVDISSLSEVDQTVHLKDIKFDKKKIEIEEDFERIIVKVEAIREEEEPVVEEAAEEEKEGGEGEKGEGEKSKEEKEGEKKEGGESDSDKEKKEENKESK